jgi:PKHD-type hydroxylase
MRAVGANSPAKISDLIDTSQFSSRNLSPQRLFKVVSIEECRAICQLGRAAGLREGQMHVPEQDYRLSLVSHIERSIESDWLFERAIEVAHLANESFQFDIDPSTIRLQYAEYPEGGLIDWHSDYDSFNPTPRKLSLSVQLSEAKDYAGGGLEFFPLGELPLTRQIGTAIAFPAFLVHRVAKITRGKRSALVIWVGGSHLR